MLVSVALVLIALTVILLSHLKLMRKSQWLQQFQGPSPVIPIIGNGLDLLGHPSEMAEIFHKNFEKFGSVWKLWLMEDPTLVTSDPELIKKLLSSHTHLDKHPIYDHSTRILLGEYGLLTSNSQQWKGDRKIINQLFNLAQIERSFKKCMENCLSLQADVEANLGKPIASHHMFRKFFLSIVLHSFNGDASLITDERLIEIGGLIGKGLDLVKLRFMKPWTRNATYWKIFGYQRKLDHFHDGVRAFIDENIKHFEVQHNLNKSANGKVEDLKSIQTVNHLLGDPNILPEWKYNNAITLVGAGTDTSTITATMTLFFLALNPECQKKALEEVDMLFEESVNGELQLAEVPKLKYLRMCIKEAMRLHAPAAVIGRTTSEAILMEDGRKIPKGAAVLIVIPEVHRNPENFSNPDKFDPERFSESNLPSIKPYTYLPFSIGPRNCIGQKYAESLLAPVLAFVLRKYSVKTRQKAADIKSIYEIAGTPYPNVELIFESR